MIIITDINGFQHRYKGNIVIHHGDILIMITCNYTDPPGEDDLTWTGNVIDGFFPSDIKSIQGTDDDQPSQGKQTEGGTQESLF